MNAIRTNAPVGVLVTLRATPASVRYLLGGVLINQMGAFVQTFLVLYLTVQGFSVGQAGAALTAYSVGAVGGTMIGAELTHRLGPRATIVSAMSASALVLAITPWLSTPSRFVVLLVAVGAAGLATQTYRPAAAVLLSELMPAEHRVMAFSMMRIALNLGAALGPLIAAGLILVDWNLLLWFDAATAMVYAALALAFLPNLPAAQQEELVEDKRSAYGVLVRDVRFLLFLASTLFGAMIYVQCMVALPLKITRDGHSATLYSATLTTASVVLILCELKITSYVQHWRSYTAGTVGTVLMAVGIAGFGLPGNSAVLILLCMVVLVFGIMINGPTMFAHPASFPTAVKARYIGVHQATFGLGLAIGPTVGVFAWQAFGDGIWPVGGALALVAAGCAFAGLRRGAGTPKADSTLAKDVA